MLGKLTNRVLMYSFLLDLVEDGLDNCVHVSNPGQEDTNLNGYGNACGADLNKDGIVDFLDLGVLMSRFFTFDPDADCGFENLPCLAGDSGDQLLDLWHLAYPLGAFATGGKCLGLVGILSIGGLEAWCSLSRSSLLTVEKSSGLPV